MYKYIVLAFLLVGCGTDGDDSDREYFETVEDCTTYETYSGTTEYCDIVIVGSRSNPEVPEPVFE